VVYHQDAGSHLLAVVGDKDQGPGRGRGIERAGDLAELKLFESALRGEPRAIQFF
jgi:hypothetical protein